MPTPTTPRQAVLLGMSDATWPSGEQMVDLALMHRETVADAVVARLAQVVPSDIYARAGEVGREFRGFTDGQMIDFLGRSSRSGCRSPGRPLRAPWSSPTDTPVTARAPRLRSGTLITPGNAQIGTRTDPAEHTRGSAS